MMPVLGTILEDRADNCDVEMQKLLGRNSRCLELFSKYSRLKPHSIRLAGSKLVADRFEAGQLRTT